MFRFLLLSCLLLITFRSYTQNKNPPDTGAYFKSFDSTKIYYEVRGTGDAVVLVHGFIVNGQSWKRTELYKNLLEEGYKVIILDQRGNGFSDKPHTPEAYENDAEAKDIMALMKKLKIKKYSAVGYSRGSIIVSRLLVLDKRIKKAVMGGMGAEFTNPEWPRRIMFYKALSGESVPELAAMVENVKKQGLDQQALAYLQKAQPSTSKEALAKIKQPVLIICGDKDSDNGSAKELADLFKHPVYRVTPGDHGSASRTKEFSKEVISFLHE
ncbi:MAG TPA: alpha/beta hydrolase [Chitinophagaceae bacterium]|jgi:pimeloyl-ACP methyl ester carboxylesterase|nr:alpha/beta hydrolase [Chitinophagaceae bacterium]